MSRTLQDDLDKNIQPWPADWDLHVIKTCYFFFDDTKNPQVDCMQISSTFLISSKSDVKPEDITKITYEELRENADKYKVQLKGIFVCPEQEVVYVICLEKPDTNIVNGVVYRVIEVDPETGKSTVVPVESFLAPNAYEACTQVYNLIKNDCELDYESEEDEEEEDDSDDDE